jgi:hypothetical protein
MHARFLSPLLLLALSLSSSAWGQSNDLKSAPLHTSASDSLSSAATFQPKSSSWNFTAGYQWRQIGDLNFNSGSHAAGDTLPWLTGKGRSGITGSILPSNSVAGSTSSDGTAGPAGANADRTYDDGYVNQDAGTSIFGNTWFWGFNDASQVSGTTLSYHTTTPGAGMTTGGGSLTSYSSQRSSWSSLGNDLGWDSELAGSGWFGRIESPAIFARGPLSASMEIGYSYASADAAHRNADVFRAHQQTRERATTTSAAPFETATVNTITDTYSLAGITVPGAPYAGTLAGPGPLISNTPETRTITPGTTITGASPTETPGGITTGSVVETTTADFFSNVSESLDVDLHTISIGPHFSWELRRVRVGLSTGLAINVADWDADYREDLYVSENGGSARLLGTYQDHKGGAKVLPGFYVEANANVFVTRRVSLFAGGRYDWAGTLRGNVGPSDFSLDLGGWTVQGGVTITF